MVEIKNLYKTYNENTKDEVTAIQGITLRINEGEIYGVIGTSGAGKSSLVRCINLLEKPTSGEILINGVDLAKANGKDLRVARQKIGMVFQHFNLLMSKTVYENVAFPMEISGFSRSEIEERVPYLLELVGLSDKSNVYPAQLSGGQKQRIGIARAISAMPELIMCDEATSALDPTTTKSILDLLKEINKKLNITIIIITHEMEVIKQICDKVAILENGKVVEEGRVIDVLVDPKSETAKEFFNQVDLKNTNKTYMKVAKRDGKLISMTFLGNKSGMPYISSIIKKFNVDANILLGNIQEVNDELIGNLVVMLEGNDEALEQSIEYLKEQSVIVEVLENAK